ncbi:hypothetical protein BaRGS_00007645 [Batillaria attramentaria]|uniref:Uncharacterized protein n=1 Tax=Batillaria attramentaria TaxID=370345 RepID=A0ABD0LNY4_9CAEN
MGLAGKGNGNKDLGGGAVERRGSVGWTLERWREGDAGTLDRPIDFGRNNGLEDWTVLQSNEETSNDMLAVVLQLRALRE